jgi:hypothetical protein
MLPSSGNCTGRLSLHKKKVCEGEKRERRELCGVFEALRDKIENELRHGKRMTD